MTPARPQDGGNVVLGIGLAVCGNAVFSLQDAVVKWLVADYGIPQVLFMRSVVIVAIAAGFAFRSATRGALQSPNKGQLVLRASCMLLAWLCYYTAARELKLADLVTLYYASPLFVTIMSIFLLGEKVHAARWIAVAFGLAGVVVAANPTGRPDLLPAGLVLIAAFLWGLSNILMRKISATESTQTQMLFTSAFFVVACAVVLPWTWITPSPTDLALMLGIGCVAGLGQYLLFEAVRHAPASVVAPCAYLSLAWAFLWGFVIWGDLPDRTVVSGAGLIVLGSAVLLIAEWRRMRARRRAAAS